MENVPRSRRAVGRLSVVPGVGKTPLTVQALLVVAVWLALIWLLYAALSAESKGNVSPGVTTVQIDMAKSVHPLWSASTTGETLIPPVSPGASTP